MRKKIVSIVALVIVLVTVACTVFAESLIGGGSGWRYNAGAVSITAHVHISGKSVVGTGTAVCGNENYTAKVTVSLEKKKEGGDWTAMSGSVTKTKRATTTKSATKKMSYRAFVSCEVFDENGNSKGTITKYSGTTTY